MQVWLAMSLMLSLNGCFLKQDRTTTVYGTITDQNGQPVDSILVLVQGVKYLTYQDLASVYSDENGNYEIVMEVPKKFNSVNSGIPAIPLQNMKFEKFYKGYDVMKDGNSVSNCCFSSIGQKTRYDFQLMPK